MHYYILIAIAFLIAFDASASSLTAVNSDETLNNKDSNLSSLNKEEPQDSKGTISDWEARLELARALSYLKRFDESITEYQKLVQAKPDSTSIREEMAKVLFYKGDTNESLQEFLKLPPEKISDSGWLTIGDIYLRNKDYQKAEKIFETYLSKVPDDDKVRFKLAEMLSWQKKYEDSVYQYRQILKNRPNDIQLRRKYAQVLTWMGNEAEAIDEWKKTLQ